MASTNRVDLTGDYALTAITQRIIADTTADLKARVMAIIEPEIDAACDRAARSLKPALESYMQRDHARGITEHVVHIITEKRSPK